MKLNLIVCVALSAVAVGMTSCNKAKEETGDTIEQDSNGMVYVQNDTVVGRIVGEEMVMPQAGTDTSVIAEGTAVVVQQNQ